MSSIRCLHVHLLRATRSHIPNPHHPFRPSLITARLSIPSKHTQYAGHGRRSYHWQTSLGTAIEGTQNLIVDLHNVTGLPWFLTIPLVAFTVGAVFRLPFQVYTQRILRRRTEFGPLLQAWNARLQADVSRDKMSRIKERQDRVMRRIYRKLGLQEWRLYSSLASFPFWLLAIDGVRRLCGGPRGLIGSLIAGPAKGTADAATSLPVGNMADSITDSAALSSAAETAHTAAAAVDPSLAIEGCLWFTDLTVADPYHILPMLLSATLVYNLLPKSGEQFSDRLRVAMGRRPKSAQAATLSGGDDKVRLGERAKATFYVSMVGLAAVIGPVTLDLPAALHLYWLASSATNAGFARGLKAFMPVRPKLHERCAGKEFSVIRPHRELRKG